SNYSLFQGSTLSDTAVFKPWRESVSASFNISRDQNPFAALTRLFGKAVPEAQKSPSTAPTQVRPRSDDTLTSRLAAQPVAAARTAGERFVVPQNQGWRGSVLFTSSR